MRAFVVSGKTVTKILIGVLALGVWVLAAEQFPGWSSQAKADSPTQSDAQELGTITVHRMNVKDANGVTRFAISNGKRSPPPIIRGKAYKRMTKNTAGMIFYNARGNEEGGFVTDTIHGNRHASMTFDYDHQPNEAIGLSVLESSNGKDWNAGFFVNDRNPYQPGPLTKKSEFGQVQRISLADSNHDAELVIRDEKGRPRIRIGVGKDGEPHIEMLNASGQVVYNAAAQSRVARK